MKEGFETHLDGGAIAARQPVCLFFFPSFKFTDSNPGASIGTYTIPEIATPFMAKISKTLDMMLGSHLDAHIMGKIYPHYYYARCLVIKCALYILR